MRDGVALLIMAGGFILLVVTLVFLLRWSYPEVPW